MALLLYICTVSRCSDLVPLIEAGDGDELGRGAEGRSPGRLVVQAFPSVPNQNITIAIAIR